MKKISLTLLSIITLSSCATGPNAQSGSVMGALGGAAVGGIIGHQSGRGLQGAALGAGVGALGGNAIGNSQDQRNGQFQQPNGFFQQQQQPGFFQQQQQQPRGFFPNGQPRF